MTRRTTRLRSSRRSVRLDFGAIEIIGGLLTPDIIARIAAFEAHGQNEESYSVPPGLKIRDEIARYFRIGEALWARFDATRASSPAASEKFVLDLLKQCFGFDALRPQAAVHMGERDFPVRHAALDGRVPLVIAPVPPAPARRSGLDESLQQFGDGTRRRSATLLLQEYLNAAEECVWGIATDGLTLRVMRDNVSLTRPAWIEADLSKIFSEGLFPDFSALWLLIHQSRFGKAKSLPIESSLELWRDTGRIEGVAARDKLRRGVEAALIELGQGFIEHPANGALRQALTDGKLSRQRYFEELLRLVYRLIFLFAAEDRELLHAPGAPQAATKAYADGYSLTRLRERCMRRTAWDRHGDAWEGLKATFAALGKGEPRLGLPALGGLFADGQLPDLKECKLDNRRLLAAIWRLAWMRPDGHPLTRVNWRDMETEELGSVYESLLELTPIASAATKTFTFAEGDETRGNARKISGSYYTPDSLVQVLLDESLDPLIQEAVAGKDDADAIKALLELRIIDPACGSGHFLLAAARRLASRIAQLSTPGTPSQLEYRHWLREVARRCLFGVDRNPMAIELAKVALWIETVEPGKPLSFLDSHLRCGDSLLGIYDLRSLEIGIPDDAYKALTGDDKPAAAAWRKLNKQARERDDKTMEFAFSDVSQELAGSASRIESQPEDDLASVEAKRMSFDVLLKGDSYVRIKSACDLYIAAFLLPKLSPPDLTAGAKGITIPTTSAVRDKMKGLLAVPTLEALSARTTNAARAFHWPLEFPQVFFPAERRKIGFDLAIGNPPWEVSQLGEEEFFAATAPEIAQLKGQERKQAIQGLEKDNPQLWRSYQIEKRIFDSSNAFYRSSGRFALTAVGKVNTYSLFAELFSMIAQRAGFIVPTELATSDSAKDFFAHVVDTGRLHAMLDFQTGMGFFDRIGHARFKFSLIALEPPRQLVNPTFKVAFFLRTQSDIADKSRYLQMSASDIAAINPNTKTAPIFRSKADAELTKHIYQRVPVLIDSAKGSSGNTWGIEFRQGLFNMTSDSDLFRSAHELAGDGYHRDGRDWNKSDGSRYVPLYEAKMIHHFDHRWATYDNGVGDKDSRYLLQSEKEKRDYEINPRYWVPEREVIDQLAAKGWCNGWLMGWRDITNATNERTVIAGVIPLSGVGNNFPLFFPAAKHSPAHSAGLLACLSSLSLDFVARHKVGGTHLNFFIAEQLPVLPPHAFAAADLNFIAPRVLELTYTSHAMKPFADDLGYQGNTPFDWKEDRRALLRAELDAKVAHLYGLTRDQLRYVLDPLEVYGNDYPSETFRGLKKNEMDRFGEYRTGRLVLQAFDQLAAGTLSTDVVRLDVSKIDVQPSVARPATLEDGAWVRPHKDQRGETGAMFVALLKAMDGPMSSRNVRLAAMLALEPRLLHQHLTMTQSAEWQRLIGDEAKPLPKGTPQFVPPSDQNWGAVVRGLRTRGALVEDAKVGTWAPGKGLDKIETEGWPDGRARFVLDVLRASGDQTLVQRLPAELKRWLDAEAA